jgi:hypothetical protein
MRHAVVIIHGIGEQKPMDTLRGFVSTVTHEPDESQSSIRFYSKPDKLSSSFELRRLTTSSSQKEGRVKTDFFEYYWAYNIRGTKVQQVLTWLGQILFRWPGSLPARIRPFHIFLWLLTLVFVFIAVRGHAWPFLKGQSAWLGIAGTVVSALLSYIFTSYIGDAARYTSAAPGNIAERQKIRKDGIALLKSLHDSGNYEKIIVVGHSLGSIIGYDIIRHLWSEYNDLYQDTKYADQLLAFEEKYANATAKDFDIDQYQSDQENLFYQQNSDGNPWRISHFITLGSPLTHASFLLAKNLEELKERMQERELPKSPPVSEFFEKKDRITYRPDVRKSRRVLHHGAPFACTQWINVYYGNDFVGGNLSEYFGAGIKEHPIKIKGSWLLRVLPFLSHTHYWSDRSQRFVKCQEAAAILKKVIWG